MKLKSKILILILILVVGGAIALISVFYKTTDKSLLKGTIGMSKKSVEIKNELTQDTLQLKRMIQIIRYFGDFTEKVCREIDTTSAILRYHPLYMDQKLNPTFIALQDYSNFLKGNLPKLRSTEKMLSRFLVDKDNSELTYNIEINLRGFANFITQMSQRQVILQQAASEIDVYLDKSVRKKLMQADISYLQNFRNQLLMDNRVTFSILEDKTSLARLSGYAGSEGSEMADADDSKGKP